MKLGKIQLLASPNVTLFGEEKCRRREHDLRTHFAAQKSETVAVDILVKAGCDVNQAMNDGATPAYIAAQEGQTLEILVADHWSHSHAHDDPTCDADSDAHGCADL
jgi:hypothetical protein